MIELKNLKNALEAIGYQKDGDKNVYVKAYPHFDCAIRVDFDEKKILYPTEKGLKLGRETTTNFSQPENFVVLECVTRLLDKGYRPEHIVLEKEWKMGHTEKSGIADILVMANEKDPLVIVECKTAGREYKNALKDMQNDGGQLFSYWQQQQNCQWLMLYASDFQNGKVTHTAMTIRCADDVNFIKAAETDDSVRIYANAHSTEERYEIWQETYAGEQYGDLIFSDDTVAYHIGIKPLRKKDLKDFAPEDKIVNRFEEILRHNNVSDKENAFNRLIALFICKLVDEITKDDDDEVEFQYKQGTDTYEALQDRLQRLHRDGMEKFMREKIYYVASDYPENLFSTYTGSKRKKAIEDLRNTIRILKFYSNNDFAFKDVHNEELFYQNGKILVEMVQLFEKYRIVYPNKHQFLGDLFEQLLNKGFKQNEGQFFTPMPITRFIWDSLPVRRMLKSERGIVYPKIIDYACGAGHFLTEAVEAVNEYIGKDGNNDWARDSIYGIEKDYRLARVAKISLFMNGAGEGNIIFGDGLENAPEKGIENHTFDILVANPPYSVKDFKQHLKLKNNDFTLLPRIGLNGGEIETLFVERIGQLLKPKGIAAVILPSSILSNDSASYTGAREQFLQHFLIRAVVAFGSKTFGATGTNTVVMFLEKYDEPPKKLDLSADAVEAIFAGDALEDWKDKDILEAYLAQIDVAEETYAAFLKRELTLENIRAAEYFNMYFKAFEESTEVKNLRNTKTFLNKNAKEQESALMEKFYNYAHAVEREKLLYFSLVYRQTTVIITAPADNKEQKDFLGYDWSNRKGNEGIQILKPGGKMYDEDNREATGTLARAIRNSFEDEMPALNEETEPYAAVVPTKDMLDFSRVNFNKAIRLNVEAVIKNTSRFKAITLSDCVDVIGGLWTGKKAPLQQVKVIRNTNFTMLGELNLDDVAEINVEVGTYSNRKLQTGDIILEKSGGSETQAVGRVVYFDLEEGDYSFSNFTARLRVKNPDVLPKYLYNILNEYYQEGKTLGYQNGTSGLKNLDMDRYLSIPIPVPPLDIQQQIIDECEKFDESQEAAGNAITAYKHEMEDVFAEIDVVSRKKKLSDIFEWGTDRISSSQIKPEEYVTTDTMLQKCAGIRTYTEAMPTQNVTVFHEGDILLSNIRPYLQKLWIATFSGACSNDVLVLRLKNRADYNPIFYFAYLKRQSFFDHIMKDVSGVKMPRGKKPHIMDYLIPVVDIEEQNEIVSQINLCEKKIQEAQEKLESLSGKTAEILDRYLK